MYNYILGLKNRKDFYGLNIERVVLGMKEAY
jgi:hypothetical protein